MNLQRSFDPGVRSSVFVVWCRKLTSRKYTLHGAYPSEKIATQEARKIKGEHKDFVEVQIKRSIILAPNIPSVEPCSV